jgi:ABC-type polysaccharide/polyol phosphate transport system ATPase subunit
MSDDAVTVDHVTKRFRVPLDHAISLQYRFAHPASMFRYREFAALEDVSFSIPKGQFVGITGPNGCGKSSLLKVMSRIYAPDSGSVRMSGRYSPFLELGVGFKQELTARQNVYLGGTVLGVTRDELAERINDVFDFAELAGFADQKLKNFSSGMVLRLAFAVAMLADADTLLMDEVLAVGDAHFQEKCFDVFAQYKRQKRTIILVSHDLAALESYCDRVLLFESGRLVMDGEPGEVVSKYRHFVAGLSDAQNSHDAARPDEHHWGTKDVEITGVRLLGADGDPHQSFSSGGEVTIAVDYRINSPVTSFVCSLRLQRSDGQYLAEPSTKPSHYRLLGGDKGTVGTLCYRIQTLPLLGASYEVAASLFDDHLAHTYDHFGDGVRFHVSDDLGRLGVLDLGGTWEQLQGGGPGAGAAERVERGASSIGVDEAPARSDLRRSATRASHRRRG